MRVVRRGAAALITACALSLGALSGHASAAAEPAARAASVQALTPWDAQLYAAAFEAARAGQHDLAAEKVAQTSDKALAGHVELIRLMSPSGPKVPFEDLSAWLDKYADHPGADRVYALARKRKPADALDPKAPKVSLGAQLWRRVQSAAAALHTSPGYVPAVDNRRYVPTAASREAREAFYGGDTRGAYHLAVASGERWVAGLAAFKLGDYVDALRRFELVARDDGEGAWMRSGAAYWASRSAIAAGAPELAPGYLQMAARTPYTFYGLLAERQLGLQSAITGEDDPDAAREIAAASAGFQRVAGGLDAFALVKMMRGDVRAKRAVALSQLGMAADAGQELRLGVLESTTDEQRRQWTTLALSLNAPLHSNADTRRVRGIDPDDFPTPYLAPRGGFNVDKAMVYAIVKQESRFNADAHSPAGARGLMQVMPTTAAYITGDDRLKNPEVLREPSTNLRVGQDYFKHLLDRLTPQGDILRAVAAYNGGPGAVMKGETNAGLSDPLMLIESLPAQETRDYVEKVVANYWVYRRIFGEDSKTLDLVASGKTADIRQDR